MYAFGLHVGFFLCLNLPKPAFLCIYTNDFVFLQYGTIAGTKK